MQTFGDGLALCFGPCSLAMAPPSGKTPKTVLDKVCTAIIALDQVGAHIDHLRVNATLVCDGRGWSVHWSMQCCTDTQ